MKRLLNTVVKQIKSRQNIVIVSGLPRSGTSMMMQMLEAGGVSILKDNHRQPDINNPKGYYEYEPVKRLYKGETSWLPEAMGQAVKVISTQLHHLPPDFDYRIIFMKRSMVEILRSQQEMLRQLGKESEFDAERLSNHYETHLDAIEHWCETRDNLQVLYVDYVDALAAPLDYVQMITQFLDLPLDQSAMIQVIDPTLHRQRADEL